MIISNNNDLNIQNKEFVDMYVKVIMRNLKDKKDIIFKVTQNEKNFYYKKILNSQNIYVGYFINLYNGTSINL